MAAIAIPIIVIAAEEVAKWLLVATVATAGTIVITKVVEDAIETNEQDKAVPIPITECPERRPCPPCNPSVGTIGYEVHRVPPSRPDWPCPGDHVHWFMRHQNPYNCQCFWKRNFIPPTCLEQGDSPELPPGAFPI